MLHSLLEHDHGTQVHVDCLHGDDTSPRSRRRLREMVRKLGGELCFHQVSDSRVEGLPTKGFTGKATWYRISLDELLPEADRIIYLDLDLLVLGSLRLLWETPLGGQAVGAVTNVPPGPDREYTERTELSGDPYFNTGVLLMDLALIRKEGLGSRLREYSVEHAARLKWRDQDALNEVLHDRRLPMHPKWNCMNAVMYFPNASEYFDAQVLEEARRNPHIRHFEGPSFNKPWHLLSDRESRRQYVYHRRQTPWARVWPTGFTAMNLLRYARRRLA
jgi:lipopolysaccharide biosynthesis glycosyltransferase